MLADHDLPRSLLIRRFRREVDATVSDYMRLRSWDEELAASVLKRMLHHSQSHGVFPRHWAALLYQEWDLSSSSYPMQQPSRRGLASQAAEVTRRLVLRLLPSRPELFTYKAYKLLLGVLLSLTFEASCEQPSEDCTEEDFALLGQQHLTGSWQQYEDTIECVLLALQRPTGQAQPQPLQQQQRQHPQQHQQQQQQQFILLTPWVAIQVLVMLCKSRDTTLLHVLCLTNCATRVCTLAARNLFDPCSTRTSALAADALSTLLQTQAGDGEDQPVCDSTLITLAIDYALGRAEAFMVWHAAYGTPAFKQAARVPFSEPCGDLIGLHNALWGFVVLAKALHGLPPAVASDLLVRRTGLLRALCALCDSAAREAAAGGAPSPVPGSMWLDQLGEQVVSSLAGCMCLIGSAPRPSPPQVRAMMLGLSCLLRVCERGSRLKATTSGMLLSFVAWNFVDVFCDQGHVEKWCLTSLDRYRARAALAVLGRTHALGRLLEAAVWTERCLERRPGGIADVSSTEPCRVMDALLSAALLSARCALFAAGAPAAGAGIGSAAGQQQQRRQHLADVQRIFSNLQAAAESYARAGGSDAPVLRVPAQVSGLVRDLQRAVAALAPHGNPNPHGS